MQGFLLDTISTHGRHDSVRIELSVVFTGNRLNMERLPQLAARQLCAKADTLAAHHVTIGLDGFVDEIVCVVDKRETAEKFTRVPTLAAFGARIVAAAGKSTNAELVVERVKLGGNGPIMANALAAFGVRVTYIGNLGYPNIHPVFAELAKRATVYSIAEPGRTDALEFEDGKIMMGKHATLGEVNWHNLVERIGHKTLADCFANASLVGLQNWTMLPHMSEIWEHVLAEICPQMPARPRHTLFLDLADPEKREAADIRHALDLIGRFQKYFDVYLGLNEKESLEIGLVLGFKGPREGEAATTALAKFIHERIKTSGVVVHPRFYAIAASATGVVKTDGPVIERPVISTGGGDHFNAGFCLGKLIGADDQCSLQLGVGTSSYYVGTARSPSLMELAEFLRSL
jgi:sugar/nucleoside kinase (ribokinase family)